MNKQFQFKLLRKGEGREGLSHLSLKQLDVIGPFLGETLDSN